MARSYKPIDPARIKTYSAHHRKHKSSVTRMASLPAPGASAVECFSSWPDYLGATSFRRVVTAMVEAVRHDRPVVAAFGAHLMKVGCGPILIDLIERGVIKAIACNGACAIHDIELAVLGETSEEVADTLRDGRFGMVKETMALFNEAVAWAQRESVGLGAAVGRVLIDGDVPYRDRSILVAAQRASTT